jgi:hemerythrin-like domain-containing protein
MPREGGPIGVMLFEHQQGRAFVRQMRESLEAAKSGDQAGLRQVIDGGRGYIDLLRNHIDKENNVLFMMADRIVDSQGCEKLCEQYTRVCNGCFDGRSKQQLEDLAEQLMASL